VYDFVTSKDIDYRKTYESNHDAGGSHYSKSIDVRRPESFNNNFRTAASELKTQNVVRLPTGCKSLDNLLYGGVEAGVITQVYGPPGSGKTQLCYTLCVIQYDAIYIDTESSFRPERIETIAKARGLDRQIMRRILVSKALDSKQQESHIEAACSEINRPNSNKIKLLVVDSIIYHYKAEFGGRSNTSERLYRLNKYMHLLLKTASSNGVAVVVTNHQMLSSLDAFDNRVIPLGGNVMSYVSKYIIYLEGRNNDRRLARLERSPSHPQSEIYFAIDEQRGFTDSE
jgi:DNA repair protein RadA